MSFPRHKIVYRGFTYYDVYSLVQSGQAAALGHGPGVIGAFNWIDNCPRATGEKFVGNKRQDLINRVTPVIEAELASDAYEKAAREEFDRYH